MKNIKAFTLVELLAVITLLGIIGLISIPIIGDVSRKSQERAFRETINGIINAAKLFNADTDYLVLDEHGIDALDQRLSYDNRDNVKRGEIVYYSDDEIYYFYIESDKYCATGSSDEFDIYNIDDERCIGSLAG